MRLGCCSEPAATAKHFTAFLTDRLGMGLYPQGLKSNPWRIDYAQKPSDCIWRPLVPSGAYRRIDDHPLRGFLTDTSTAMAAAYHRVRDVKFNPSDELAHMSMSGHVASPEDARRDDFCGDREAVVDVAMFRAFHVSNVSDPDESKAVLLMRCATVTDDYFIASMILECALALGERDRNVAMDSKWMRRQLGDGTGRRLLERSGAGAASYETYVRDFLVGSYNYAENAECDPLSAAAVRFQILSLLLNDRGLRHNTAQYVEGSCEPYRANEMMARRVAEDHLRIAWALIASEPVMRERWIKASDYVGTALSYANRDPSMREEGLVDEIEGFRELISLFASTGRGLQLQERQRVASRLTATAPSDGI